MRRRFSGRQTEISEPSAVAFARSAASRQLDFIELPEETTHVAAIVISELGNNILRHAEHGQLLLTSDGYGLMIVAIDEGPGIRDIRRALEDGHSGAGTAGIGLGAILRGSDEFDIYSAPTLGTVAMARIGPRPPSPFEAEVVMRPKIHQDVSGDAVLVHEDETGILLCVLDGLGHGPQAAAASDAALAAVDVQAGPAEVLEQMHRASRKTRGSVAAVIRVDAEGHGVFAGVGNVSAWVANEEDRHHLVSKNGALGSVLPRLETTRFELGPDDYLAVHTDGLTSAAGAQRPPGLGARHAGVIAGVLYRDFARRTDDATVAVLKMRGRSNPA